MEGAGPGARQHAEGIETIVFDVTFVDDEAIVITAAVPRTLVSKFDRAVELLVEAFDHYGMSINWKPGKTEAIVVLRGKRAKLENRKLWQGGGVRAFHVKANLKRLHLKSASWDIKVIVVSQYKHLGGIIDAPNSFVPEAHQRAKSAMHAFAPLAKRVLGSAKIGRRRRTALAQSLVISRLTFGVHV